MIDNNKLSPNDNLEEEDPLAWLDRHRREISERFDTMEELAEYLKQFNSIEAALIRVQARITSQEQRVLEAVK